MSRYVNLAKYLVVVGFAAWCAYALRGDLAQLSLEPVLRSWELVAAAAVLSLLNYAFRIVRWRWYLARLGYALPRPFAALSFLAGFAYTLSPGKLGEMVRARYYVPLGIPLREVTAAFFAERLLDLVAMTILATLILSISPSYQGTIIGVGVGVAIILVLLATLPWSVIAERVTHAERGPRLLRKAAGSVATALASTRALLTPAALAGGFVLGMIAWSLEGVGLGVLSSMFPHVMPLNWVAAAGIYGVAVLIGGLSFLPGGLGGTEAIMTALLVTQGFAVGQALLMTLLCRLLTLWLAVILGWGAVGILRGRSLQVVQPWS